MKKRDFILILSIVVVAITAFLVIHFTKVDGDSVAIYVDSELVEVISLEDDGIYELNGGTNVLKIEGKEAFMIEANCPDKKCIKEFGHIKSVGESITCLPNKIVVRVVDKNFKG